METLPQTSGYTASTGNYSNNINLVWEEGNIHYFTLNV
jgi:hypothetical protein